MKKITYLTMGLAALVAMSCVNEVEDLFEQNASERTNAAVQECMDLLTSSEYGWTFNYYPSEERTYGGYAFAARFDKNGDVEVTTETAADVAKTITSHYSVITSSGPLLSFDTYNDYINYWSDPDLDDRSGNIYEGEFEFAYVRGNKEEMIFRGIKTDNIIVFKKLEENMVSYMKRTVDMTQTFPVNFYVSYDFITPSGEPMHMINNDDYSVLSYYPGRDEATGGLESLLAYGFTEKGLTFYEPLTVNGVSAQTFEWDEENVIFKATDGKDAKGNAVEVKLQGNFSETYLPYDEFLGDYDMYFQYAGATGSYPVLAERVTISELEKNKTFTMTVHNENSSAGINYNNGPFSFTVGYSKSGNLSIKAGQFTGTCTYSGNEAYCYLRMIGCVKGSTSIYSSPLVTHGLIITHETDEEGHLVLHAADNGVWKRANGFAIYAHKEKSASSSVGYYTRLQRYYWAEKFVKR